MFYHYTTMTKLELLKKQGLPRLSLKLIDRFILSGVLSSQELVGFCHTLATSGEPLNIYEQLCDRDLLLEQAKQADYRISRKERWSQLDGIPMSVKGNFAIADFALTAGSRVLKSDHPIGYDADVVRILKDHGSIVMGSTTLDEFGMGSLGTYTSYSEATRNPVSIFKRAEFDAETTLAMIKLPAEAIREAHESMLENLTDDSEYVTGGSSSGSAASVAHGSALFSIGSDTGGSVRLPSAWCNLVGFKPSYGILSRNGLVSYASSLDTVGCIANTVGCAASVYSALINPQVHSNGVSDSTQTIPDESYHLKLQASVEALPELEHASSLTGLRIGIPSAFSVAECPQQITQLWESSARVLETHGAEIHTIPDDLLSSNILQRALAAYYVLASAEASSNLSRYDGFRYGAQVEPSSFDDDLSQLENRYAASRTKGLGTEVIRRILCGTSVLSSDRFHTHYEAAARLRGALTKQFNSILDDAVHCDLLLVPTALFPPPKVSAPVDQTQMLANDLLTVPASLAGLPAISVPVGIDLMKSGMQLIAGRKREHALFSAANVLAMGGS